MSATADPSVRLLDACDDPRLLAFPLWPRQRVLLNAVERGRNRQSQMPTSAASVVLPAVAVATNQRQARLFVQAARTVVEASPLLSRMVEQDSDDEILFSNGTALSAFPCTSRGARGWPISTLLMDEAAHMLDTEGNQAAESVYRALVPSTAQFGDAARVIVSSTPFGTDGLFAELHLKAKNGEIEDALAVHATSAEVNPTLDPSFLSREHARDPEGFRSEYLAEFVGGGGAFLDPERIAAAVADRAEIPPEHGTMWVAGLDPAFSSDPFGLALVGRDPQNQRRMVLGLARSWRSRSVESFDERRVLEDAVLNEVATICKRYGATVVTDQYVAGPVTEYLSRRGLNVRAIPMTATSKTAAYTELRARLYTHGLELYDHPELVQELRRLRTRYAAGHAAVVNPRVGGSHGDMAQALALAVMEQASYGDGEYQVPTLHNAPALPIESVFGPLPDLFDPITGDAYL